MLPPRIVRLVSPLAALLLALAVSSTAGAQGFPGGGGGMGPGGGGRGGRGGRGGQPPGGMRADRGAELAKRLERMASLDDATKGVEGLDRTQKDSLKRIEARYGEHFKGYGREARRLFESASDGPPDTEAMRKLQDGARTLREEELAAARAVLRTDAQRARFDANVAAQQEAERKRMEQVRQRRGRMEGGGPPVR